MRIERTARESDERLRAAVDTQLDPFVDGEVSCDMSRSAGASVPGTTSRTVGRARVRGVGFNHLLHLDHSIAEESSCR